MRAIYVTREGQMVSLRAGSLQAVMDVVDLRKRWG